MEMKKRGFTLVEAIMSFAITVILATGLAFVFRSHMIQWFRGDMEARRNVAFAMLFKSLYTDVKRADAPLEVDEYGNLNLAGELSGMPRKNRIVTVIPECESESGRLEITAYSLRPFGEKTRISYAMAGDKEHTLIRYADGEKTNEFGNISKIIFRGSSNYDDRITVTGTFQFPEDASRRIEERLENFTMEIRLAGVWSGVEKK